MKVIVHNSVSLDGSIKNFQINIPLHYQTADYIQHDVKLVGSRTAQTGIESFGDKNQSEKESDFKKPKDRKSCPYWAVADTGGILQGKLHHLRRFKFCRDLIVFISKDTSDSYRDYLQKRSYDYYVVGKDRVNFKEAFNILEDRYRAKTVLTDGGPSLIGHLINRGLIDEVSLVISPHIAGKKTVSLFKNVKNKVELIKIKCSEPEKNYLWKVYEIKKRIKYKYEDGA